ncbi:MAG: DUF7487 domain-containing protein [Nitrososphaeraceae archaeon]
MEQSTLIKELIVNKIINEDLSLHVRCIRNVEPNPLMMDEILKTTSFLNKDVCIKTRLQVIIQNIHEQPVCKTCNQAVKMRLSGVYNNTFPEYCSSKCSSVASSTKEKRIATNLKKYGATSFLTSIEGKQVARQTNLEKYGVENSLQSPEIRSKIKQTNLEKYGSENPLKNVLIKERAKQTNIQKYGVENPLQSSEIRNKIKQTNLEKYGVDNIFKDIKKMKQSRLDSIGVEFPIQSDCISNKIKQTMVARYGREYALQCVSFKQKFQATMLQKYNTIHALKNNKIKQIAKQTILEKYGVDNVKKRHLIPILLLLEDNNWLFDQYINQNKTATQIANELGDVYYGTIINYLKKAEIEIRYTHNYSYKCIQWLESIMQQEGIYIQHAMNGGEYKIPGTRYKADGYCFETNTIYEFHGDYWHGNPKVYLSDEINESIGKTMGDLYKKTIAKENKIRELGYNLVVVWEEDFIYN